MARSSTSSPAPAQISSAPPCLPGTAQDVGSIPPAASGPFGFDPMLDGVPDTCASTPSQVQPSRANQHLLRFDHAFTSRDRVFVRWVANHAFAEVGRQELLSANMRGFGSPLEGMFADLGVGYTRNFSSNLLNTFRFAYSRNDSEIRFEVPAGSVRTQLEAAGTPNFFAHLSFDDGVIPFGGAIFIPRRFLFNTFTLADTVTQIVGRHGLKFGGEVRMIREDSNYELENPAVLRI